MSEFKGTPGSWKVVFQDKDKPGIDAFDENGRAIKTVILWGDKSDYAGIIGHSIEQQANAQLISCAPEMLDLLQHFIDNNMLSHAGDELAKELIKKATTI